MTNYADPWLNSTAYQSANPVQTSVAPSGTTGVWVTPQDYGAVGDGMTDDTSAIQDAIAGAYALGCELRFQACTHVISSSLTVPPGLTIEGVRHFSYIKFTGSGALFQLPAASGWPIKGNTIRNLSLQGTYSGGSPDSVCAVLCNEVGDGSAHAYLEGLDILSFSQGLDGCMTSGLIEKCFIGSCYYPIRLGATASFVTVRDCKILGNIYGICGLGNPIVQNCDIEACSADSIYLPIGGVITDCHLEGAGGTTVGIRAGEACYISHNNIGAFGTGIYVLGTDYDMVIRENFFGGQTSFNIDYGRAWAGQLLIMANYYLNGVNNAAGATAGRFAEITTADLISLVVP